jgi:hypothetical protein
LDAHGNPLTTDDDVGGATNGVGGYDLELDETTHLAARASNELDGVTVRCI